MFGDTSPMVGDHGEVLAADRGYNSGGFVRKLWHEHGIRPVIEIRKAWRDEPDETSVLGTGSTFATTGGARCTVVVLGPEWSGRRSVGFRVASGDAKVSLSGLAVSWDPSGEAGSVRSSEWFASEDGGGSRRFSPISRGTARWAVFYAWHSWVERINSRLDVSFGFERH